MLKLLVTFFVLGLASSSSVMAQLQDLKISAARKKLDESTKKAAVVKSTTKEIVYVVTVQNATFKNMPEVDVKYMVFYEDTKAAARKTAR